MPKTIQVRNIDDQTYLDLRMRAAEDGVTVPELLRSEISRIASRPTMAAWLKQAALQPPSDVDGLAAVREVREAARL